MSLRTPPLIKNPPPPILDKNFWIDLSHSLIKIKSLRLRLYQQGKQIQGLE